MEKILITGAGGQLGSELTIALAEEYGADAIIATDINEKAKEKFDYCTFELLDVLDSERMTKLVKDYQVTQIYHLAAILSAVGEKKPLFTWKLNMDSLLHVLELAKDGLIQKVYWPSSIAIFGTHTPIENTPQHTVMDPTTVYGISKLAGERWCEYYHQKYGVDVRSLRYPGLIGYKSAAGGGTTDYAVNIYRSAISGETFECFLEEDTYLPMMYMPDAIKATLQLMKAPKEDISIRSSYNISAISFSPADIYQSIKKHYPDFRISYKPDFRQKIATSWPDSIDDTQARLDWDWQNDFDLDKMTADILKHIA
ncbi:NAD-dependent epimerase/dehydratase family protein [Galbibacter sp. EGI 63066]|uniref:NAD-dependent epimerase/dehydratase family protein n=1 Tax=Galbibacter sp. EGI 63066 TaxID=2993559 RepID=UPI002248C6A1|nr:NAD-dependent epimerase/dehydratase family protein [Galbibacter sp. EGI 63066]MCX2679616.1 NAD-dependent epimerase/dehydratase family protein [Galbibacter sp. EGI 63066]